MSWQRRGILTCKFPHKSWHEVEPWTPITVFHRLEVQVNKLQEFQKEILVCKLEVKGQRRSHYTNKTTLLTTFLR